MIRRSVKHNQLLELIQEEGMAAEDIAKIMQCTVKCVFNYLKALRKEKRVYICEYEPTLGKLKSIYKAGNRPDVEKPVRDYKYYRNREKPFKFVVQPDVAAAWMFNPC